MAEAPAPPRGGGPLAVITRKVGPLPVWAYAALLVVGYFLYRRLHPSSSTSSTASGSTTSTDQAYVPSFDAATSAGSGGIGSASLPQNVYNYYYGDTAAGQASGGGTSSGGDGSGGDTSSTGTGGSSSPTASGAPPGHVSEVPLGVNPAESVGAFQVPVRTQLGAGGGGHGSQGVV